MIKSIIRKNRTITKTQKHFHHHSFHPYSHYQSFLPILLIFRIGASHSNILDNRKTQRRILNRKARKHPPLHFHPKYTVPFSISRRFESPLKIHWKPFYSRVCTDFWRITTRSPYYGIQQRFQTPFHCIAGIPVTEDENRFETACVTGRPPRDIGNPRWGFSVHRGRSGEQRCSLSPLPGARFVHPRGICIQSATLRWYLNHETNDVASSFLPSWEKRASWFSLREMFEKVQWMDGSLVEKKKMWNNDAYFFYVYFFWTWVYSMWTILESKV